jgi:hypothetical protein
MGVVMVIAAWGEGVNVCLWCLCPSSPSSDRASFAQSARKIAEAWSFKEYMMNDDGARVLGGLMVIAARGEGVNVCLCPPSPSSDRSSIAQNAHKNNTGWGPRTRPHLPRGSWPPPAPNQ